MSKLSCFDQVQQVKSILSEYHQWIALNRPVLQQAELLNRLQLTVRNFIRWFNNHPKCSAEDESYLLEAEDLLANAFNDMRVSEVAPPETDADATTALLYSLQETKQQEENKQYSAL